MIAAHFLRIFSRTKKTLTLWFTTRYSTVLFFEGVRSGLCNQAIHPTVLYGGSALFAIEVMSMEQLHNVAPNEGARRGDEFSGDLVQHALAAIFQSAPFRASKQSQQLLRYIVDHSLSGHGELLKERLIGVNVFRRQPDYDTNEDPIVRARAAEVRKRLAQFYLGEGSHSAIRIEIAPGSYHALFRELPERAFADATPQSHVQPVPQSEVPLPDSSPSEISKTAQTVRARRHFGVVSLVPITLLCVAALVWLIARPIAPIDQFWRPFVQASNPVVIYSGSNAVYMLSSGFMDRYKANHRLDSLQSQGREFTVPISSDMKLGADDLVPFTNDFVTIGDLSANVRVASLLSKRGKSFDLRCGEDVAFSDLRQSPAVLIGAFNNSWTMELTGDLPYTFQHSGSMTIRNQASQTEIWSPTYTSDDKVSIDYAVVTRMPHSKTGQALITIAGITQAGTHAAADFITDPEQMKKLAAIAPIGWPQRNFQFVLQTKVVNNIPTSPTIVATKAW